MAGRGRVDAPHDPQLRDRLDEGRHLVGDARMEEQDLAAPAAEDVDVRLDPGSQVDVAEGAAGTHRAERGELDLGAVRAQAGEACADSGTLSEQRPGDPVRRRLRVAIADLAAGAGEREAIREVPRPPVEQIDQMHAARGQAYPPVPARGQVQ